MTPTDNITLKNVINCNDTAAEKQADKKCVIIDTSGRLLILHTSIRKITFQHFFITKKRNESLVE